MVSAKSSCRDITCESVPGSLPLFIFFVGARGEPGNEANNTACSKLSDHTLPLRTCYGEVHGNIAREENG